MSGPGDLRRPVSSGAGAPPPRRAPAERTAPVAAGAAGAAGVAPTAPPSRRSTVVAPETPAASGPEVGRRRTTTAPAPASTRRAPIWLRVVAWVVAVPLGLALVGIPARELGYLDSQKLLDVLIGDDTGRYLPLVVIVLLWALVTALLVQLMVEGGGWLLRRRRARRATV